MDLTKSTSSLRGISLLETLAAMSITAVIAASAFQLFHQNERLFRDQALILEMQQSARVIVAQVAEDVRRAGQSIPPGLTDVILPGSGSTRINLRSSPGAVEANVVSSLPLPFMIGTASTVAVDTTSGLTTGRQAFVWAETAWVRATIESVSAASRSVRLTPTAASSPPLEFAVPPVLSLDEGVAIFWDATTRTIRRTTTSNTENPTNPVWAPANELVANVAALTFAYLDADGTSVNTDTPENSSRVRGIDVRVVVRASAPLSDNSRPTYSLSSRAVPRNMALR
ncbi:MAG TPA: hypothetical protein VFR18_01270 [Terriglobia bacterium]|nr:hypothetical protein [Terriglobia bacterium]